MFFPFQKSQLMLTFNFSPFPILHSNRLSFRQISHADIPEILFLRSDARTMEFMDSAPAKDENDALAYITRANASVVLNEGITWGITLKGENKIIGYIGFWNMQAAHYRIETGYILHPDYWRQGLMSEALQTIIDYAFNQTELHSIEANVGINNKPSMALLEKNGFVKEAHFRENYFYNGEFLDSIIYCLVRGDVCS
jgi:ribosomal-protein-alanine N-acetyltransferase